MQTLSATQITLRPMNAEYASFKCNETLSGLIHTPKDKGYTVLLDGGYILGDFDCEICAIKTISFLCIDVERADKSAGMTYEAYKKAFMDGAASHK